MNRKEAERRIGIAGRELGPGPRAAVERIVPGVAEEISRIKLHAAQSVRDDWKERLARAITDNDDARIEMANRILTNLGEVDAARIASAGGQFAYGMAVGLVMAEHPDAMAVLNEIYEEWRGRS